MCGIVGAVSSKNIIDVLLKGISQLEYRGYDSTGIAYVAGKKLKRERSTGRVAKLTAIAEKKQINATIGLAHTRWATHGVPSEANAHPHFSVKKGLDIAIVHNGIVENHDALRQQMKEKGYQFTSQTDTEVMVHHVHSLVSTGLHLFEAVQKASLQWEGAFAVGFISNQEPDILVAARKGSPLLLGLGKKENFIASDASALIGRTRQIVYLEEGDIVRLSALSVEVVNAKGQAVKRKPTLSQLGAEATQLGPYRHYMQKEIFEQPGALANTLENVVSRGSLTPRLFGPQAGKILNKINNIVIIACGTSYHAGMVARYWMESLAGISTSVEIASEYRYRQPVADKEALVITISQSGETADTLAALKFAQSMGIKKTLSICNVPESALVRQSKLHFLTRAGPEIGVASTKAFTTQLAALFVLVLVLAKLKKRLTVAQEKKLLMALRHLPRAMESVLAVEPQVAQWAKTFKNKNHALFLGRGVHYPIAMEGALKLKEISYIHAEAYAAGELKHGPLALVDADMPVIAVAPQDELLEKLKSNLQEVQARGGQLFVFADRNTQLKTSDQQKTIALLDHAGYLSPILHVVPLQLLAYHVALLKGTDVDKPRNLAKSVTVE